MYKSEETGFITYRDVELSRIFVKNGNNTVGYIDIAKDWKMEGQITDIKNFPWFIYPLYWGQAKCEETILMRVPPNRGEEILKSYAIEKYDVMTLLFMTRGIQMMDRMWFAWSEDDKAEDYHP